MRFPIPTVCLAFFVPVIGGAAVTTSGDFSDGSPTPTLNITAPITFTITTNGTVQRLIFDEWVTDDGTATTLTVATPTALSYHINGGATQFTTVVGLTDNQHTPSGALSANDGYLSFFPISVTAGQTLTILAATIAFNADAAFNQPPFMLGGDARLTNGSGTAISAPVSIPEPSVTILGGLGFVALLRRRVC